MMALCGFVFYIAVGGKLLSSDFDKIGNFEDLLVKEKALGSLCIINGFVFLSDTIISTIKCKKGDL